MFRSLLLFCVLMAPTALAQTPTLASLEEPHSGTDKVWPIVITEEEADRQRALIFRNTPTAVFGLIVYDDTGATVYERNGTRGIQTLPALPAGEYRFFVRGAGSFQVTERAFERMLNLTNVSTTLNGTHAYVLASTQTYLVDMTGDARFEWWDLTASPEELTPPANRTAPQGAYVITVRGSPGAAYAITLTPTDPPATTPAETPISSALAFAALSVAAVILAKRRR